MLSISDANPGYVKIGLGEMIPKSSVGRVYESSPASMGRWSNAGSLLGQRRRQWANIEPATDQRPVFAGNCDWDIRVVTIQTHVPHII